MVGGWLVGVCNEGCGSIMAPCAGNRSTPVAQAPPASSLRSSAPASGHPADACYRFRLHVSWPRSLSLSFLGRDRSLLPSGSPSFKVSRGLRQSLVASLLVSLSPVLSQVSAILMVLETWSQGHKNSPSRRGVQGVRKPPSRGSPGGPGGPPRGAPPGGPAGKFPRGPRGPGSRFSAVQRVFAIWGVFGHFGGFSGS